MPNSEQRTLRLGSRATVRRAEFWAVMLRMAKGNCNVLDVGVGRQGRKAPLLTSQPVHRPGLRTETNQIHSVLCHQLHMARGGWEPILRLRVPVGIPHYRCEEI
ncbi:hypothetical protein RJ55_00314 [Drechmeria coniospora]|nr:hypothetical protein RJ55_00314 [Drechmeria coniospora]